MKIQDAAILSALAIAASCTKAPEYDAQGAFEATEITVSSEGTGTILVLDVEEGDSVYAGRSVGLIDTLQLHLQKLEARQQMASVLSSRPNVEAQLASLRQQLAGAITERDRTARLLAEGAATQRQLDNYNTQVATLSGQIEATRSSLAVNTASLDDRAAAIERQIASLNEKIARCNVVAPINGIVLAKIAEPGEVAVFGTPLFKIADMGNMYLRAYFTSDQLSSLRLGQKVRVLADYGGGNTREYPGTVSFISPTSEFTPKTIQTRDSRANLVYAVKIAVPNDGLLKIGLSGEVYLEDTQGQNDASD